MNLDNFLVEQSAPLKDALQKINANHHGIIIVTDATGAVIAVATDGDIRQHLLDGASIADKVGDFANTSFVWGDEATPREVLLKQLDHHIRVIPLLNRERQLVGIVSRDHFPVPEEAPTYARARSPVRISFGGGGSDLTHYFAGDSGAVINTTISLYSHATMRVREDKKIVVHSRDLGASLYADNLADAVAQKGSFGLIQALLKAVHPEFGFELYLHSDFPMNSGLGGSAVVSAAILGCFNQFRRDKWDLHELSELAFQAERLYLGVAGGWQDQYATVFGGFNFMEFRMDQNIVHPLRIHSDILLELEESLVLCDTGKPHDSGDIHQDQHQHMQQESVRDKVKSNVDLTYRMRNHLLRGRLLKFGESMHEAWQFKRQFSSKISNKYLDDIYDSALRAGAIGGKLLGAGGGGFFLFYAPPFQKHTLIDYLESQGLKVRPFRFEQDGLRAWSARDSKNQMDIHGQ
ncbi:MAG: CBS domain-containing protein [Oxalicibacterium faecigallinarum]|uniref:GHMP family kinase ATP-binding protein n=1 Tax=Oxalicibacterium faecigallinarum TaxID=573741 RepID=UPI00280761F4|nr:CBS domain-containing protein [Oxalicibacterium faecigallinarum]MDQ7969613.1 CBS domain-containing protein [Oxalicibacterium faecigallinarum]